MWISTRVISFFFTFKTDTQFILGVRSDDEREPLAIPWKILGFSAVLIVGAVAFFSRGSLSTTSDYAARNVKVYKKLYRSAISQNKLAPQWREVLLG